MTIKLSEEEFLTLVEDNIRDEFNISTDHELRINHSYSGVEITTYIPKPKPEADTPEED